MEDKRVENIEDFDVEPVVYSCDRIRFDDYYGDWNTYHSYSDDEEGRTTGYDDEETPEIQEYTSEQFAILLNLGFDHDDINYHNFVNRIPFDDVISLYTQTTENLFNYTITDIYHFAETTDDDEEFSELRNINNSGIRFSKKFTTEKTYNEIRNQEQQNYSDKQLDILFKIGFEPSSIRSYFQQQITFDDLILLYKHAAETQFEYSITDINDFANKRDSHPEYSEFEHTERYYTFARSIIAGEVCNNIVDSMFSYTDLLQSIRA